MDGSSATRVSSSSPSQQTQQTQRTPPKEAARALPPVVGKPFAGVLAASLGHRAGHAPLAAALRGRPSPSGASLANAARRAAGGATPGAATGAAAKGKKGEPDDDETDPDARGAGAEAHQMKADDKSRDARDLDLLDPATRQAAMLAPPLIQIAPAAAAAAHAEAPLRARTMEELLPALVKRIAWAGDKNRGTVHLELGAGAYAGTKITVHADAGKVRVELAGQEGPDLDRLRTRLDERLRGHGLDVESVT